jgi:retinol dehydrogenase-12
VRQRWNSSLEPSAHFPEELAKDTGYDGAELLLIDMATFASVSTFVDEFEKTHDRLDILMLNAGVALFEYQVSKEGFEMQCVFSSLAVSCAVRLRTPCY